MNTAMAKVATAQAIVLNDPAASDWLKTAIRQLAARDPLDALRDAEVLVALCLDRWNASVAHCVATAHPTAAARDDSGSVAPLVALGAAIWIAGLYALANAAALAPLARITAALAGGN